MRRERVKGVRFKEGNLGGSAAASYEEIRFVKGESREANIGVLREGCSDGQMRACISYGTCAYTLLLRLISVLTLLPLCPFPLSCIALYELRG